MRGCGQWGVERMCRDHLALQAWLGSRDTECVLGAFQPWVLVVGHRGHGEGCGDGVSVQFKNMSVYWDVDFVFLFPLFPNI